MPQPILPRLGIIMEEERKLLRNPEVMDEYKGTLSYGQEKAATHVSSQ